MTLYITLISIGAYILGSIPTAVWVGKWFYQKDIRDYGSGNAGFTNALRVLGKKAGIPVLIIDVLKGIAAVKLSGWIAYPDMNSEIIELLPVTSAGLAIVGHIFPIFAGFRGGKGVATGMGIVLALFPLGAFIALGLFLIILIASRYVSLGSLIAGLSLPITILLTGNGSNTPLLIFSISLAGLIVITHRYNIKRIIKGEENKVWFRKKAGAKPEE